MIKKEKGITLVALVITIIVLLILAGVTISSALGQNGLFQRAKLAGEKYKESEEKESEDLSTFESEFDNIEKVMDKEGIYIDSEEDLINLRNAVNEGNNFSGKTIYLKSDIKLTQENWEPIGKGDKKFSGVFNGNNHTISELKISSDQNNIGLFGNNEGTIKNLKVSNVNIVGKEYVGTIAGLNDGGTIENVTVSEGTLSIDKLSGGIVGKNSKGTIKSCTNKLNIKENKEDTGSYAEVRIGGIVGQNDGKSSIENCTNYGNISIYNYLAGGIVRIK